MFVEAKLVNGERFHVLLNSKWWVGARFGYDFEESAKADYFVVRRALDCFLRSVDVV